MQHSKSSKGSNSIAYNVLIDLTTEIVGDLIKSTFIDKKLILSFFVEKEDDNDDLTATRKIGSVSLNLVDLFSHG